MPRLSVKIARQILTTNQRGALAHLAALREPGAWVRGDYLAPGAGRTLSTLVVYGLAEGRQVKAARRTDWRLTAAGAEYVAKQPDPAALAAYFEKRAEHVAARA